MFANFNPRHILPLFVATTTTFGGLISLFNAEHSILSFGLPKRIAVSQPAQSVMILSSARVTAIGLALYTLYFQDNLAAVDILLAISGYIGLVDAYVCWKEGVRITAIVRLTMTTTIAVWGWFGMTA
ncbi:hypothetical protein CPB83DRAFT_724634, partial [Crepidotus variabilis]